MKASNTGTTPVDTRIIHFHRDVDNGKNACNGQSVGYISGYPAKVTCKACAAIAKATGEK